ncbi:hypothetical protein WDU94_014436 [Cyamophila willieti]
MFFVFLQVICLFLCIVLVTLATCSPVRKVRETDSAIESGGDNSPNAIEPTGDNTKQDLITAETFWGPSGPPGPWGPPPPWAFGPGPFGPGPFGPFGPGPFGPGPFGPGPFGMFFFSFP